MDELFATFMCQDHLTYEYIGKLCCIVSDADHPRFEYNDTTWENIIKQKMTDREWLENETPRARKARKVRVPHKTRRRLFKVRKGKKNRVTSNEVSSTTSSTSQTQKSPISCSFQRRLKSSRSPVTLKQKLSPSTSAKPCIPKTRRCLFELSNKKRKRASPMQTAPLKRKQSTTPTSCTNGLLPSTASVSKAPSSERPSSASSGTIKEVNTLSLSPFTGKGGNLKRKRNSKKCDGKKFRKMVNALFVYSDKQSDIESSSHNVAQNHQSPTLICRGTFHQGSHNSFHYPGQQCSAIALSSLLYSTLMAVDSWDASNVDEILLLGDRIHFHQLCHLKKSPNDDQKLTLDEVPNGVTMLNYTFSIEGREIVAGTIKEKGERVL